jgi:hypothetical protein
MTLRLAGLAIVRFHLTTAMSFVAQGGCDKMALAREQEARHRG